MALFLISNPPVLYPEQVVLHRFSSQHPDLQLEEVLYLAAGAALMQAGLSSIREGDAGDYVLVAQYTSEKEEAEVQYTFFRAQAPEDILADMTVDLRVDGSLDARVSAAVLRLLQTAAIELVPSPQAKIEGLLPDSPPAIVEGKTEPGETATPAPTDATAQEASADATTHEASADVAAQKASADATTREAWAMKFDSSISASGVILFGAVTEFLHYGVGGLLRAGVTWPRTSWSLTLDAEVSFIRAFNDVGVTGGPLSLSAAGLRVQVGTGTSTPYHVGVGVSGGAAMIIVEGAGKPMIKTAPYAETAVQAAIPFGGNVLLGAEARFLAIIADDLLILAVAPALLLRIEL